jgi:hypothetical protein
MPNTSRNPEYPCNCGSIQPARMAMPTATKAIGRIQRGRIVMGKVPDNK